MLLALASERFFPQREKTALVARWRAPGRWLAIRCRSVFDDQRNSSRQFGRRHIADLDLGGCRSLGDSGHVDVGAGS
jgi:hypothetical protein